MAKEKNRPMPAKSETPLLTEAMEAAAKRGFFPAIADVAYCVLAFYFKECEMTYSLLFDTEDYKPYDEYRKTTQHAFLSEWTAKRLSQQKDDPKTALAHVSDDELTFEENKAELIKLLDDIKKMKESGDLAAKDAVKLETDIRTRLNDKFKVESKDLQQQIVVTHKFDRVCPYTRKECYEMSKEFAMEAYGLIDPHSEA